MIPKENTFFMILDTNEIKLLNRLRLKSSHLNEHKFQCNVRATIDPMCRYHRSYPILWTFSCIDRKTLTSILLKVWLVLSFDLLYNKEHRTNKFLLIIKCTFVQHCIVQRNILRMFYSFVFIYLHVFLFLRSPLFPKCKSMFKKKKEKELLS